MSNLIWYSHAGGEVVSAGGSRLLLLPPATSCNTTLKVSSRRPAHTAPSYFTLRHCATTSFMHFYVHFCPFSFHLVFGISKLQRWKTSSSMSCLGYNKGWMTLWGRTMQCEFDCFLCLFNYTCLYNLQTHITCPKCCPVSQSAAWSTLPRQRGCRSCPGPASVAMLAPSEGS